MDEALKDIKRKGENIMGSIDVKKISGIISKNGMAAYAINQEITQIFEIVKNLAYDNARISIGSDATAELLEYIKSIHRKSKEIYENNLAGASMLIDAMEMEINEAINDRTPDENNVKEDDIHTSTEEKKRMSFKEFYDYVERIKTKYNFLIRIGTKDTDDDNTNSCKFKLYIPNCEIPDDVHTTSLYPVFSTDILVDKSDPRRYSAVDHFAGTYWFSASPGSTPLSCDIFVPLDDSAEFEKETGIKLDSDIFHNGIAPDCYACISCTDLTDFYKKAGEVFGKVLYRKVDDGIILRPDYAEDDVILSILSRNVIVDNGGK